MRIFFLTLLIMTCLGCNSTQQPPTETAPFTGIISASQLIEEYPQFKTVYEQYQPSSAEVAAMQSLTGKSLVVLFGTWCHDSVREVPRLLKLLDVSKIKLESMSLHGVNYKKQEPNNVHQQFDLMYTPTIILLKNGVELGRIIEKPVVSLSEDLAEFANKQ